MQTQSVLSYGVNFKCQYTSQDHQPHALDVQVSTVYPIGWFNTRYQLDEQMSHNMSGLDFTLHNMTMSHVQCFFC